MKTETFFTTIQVYSNLKITDEEFLITVLEKSEKILEQVPDDISKLLSSKEGSRELGKISNQMSILSLSLATLLESCMHHQHLNPVCLRLNKLAKTLQLKLASFLPHLSAPNVS